MIRNYLFFTACLILFLGTSCGLADDEGLFDCVDGSGDSISQELDLDDFSKIKLTIAADVYLTQGDVQKVEVEAPQNVIHELDLDIRNDTWEIEFDECVKNYEDMKIYITIPEIKELNISGSGTVYGENDFNIEDLKIRISGSGDIDIFAEMKDLDAKITGSGKVKLGGTGDKLELNISGSGDYRLFDMIAEDVEVKVSGSGDTEVTANDELDVDISGSGDVYYKGEPELRTDISGSGDVIDAN